MHPLSKTEREALKSIHRITIERRRGEEAAIGARTGDLSNELGLTPGTITLTLKRLAEQGYVNHNPYKGATLTDKGVGAAVASMRRHRIVERFLSDVMGYSWQEADRLAPTFEHALPDEVEVRMYELLGEPDACPHGFGIPVLNQDVLPELDTLFELSAGDSGTVAFPGSLDDEVVAYLGASGIAPGISVRVIEKKQYDGLISLSVGGQERVIGERVARQVFVRRFDIAKEQTA